MTKDIPCAENEKKKNLTGKAGRIVAYDANDQRNERRNILNQTGKAFKIFLRTGYFR